MKNINRITFFNFLSILLLQGISFLSAPLFSRLLGTDGYGNLGSFVTWSNVTCIVLSLQTNVTIANARVEFSEQEQSAYQSAVMSLSLLAFALGAAVATALAGPISSALKVERYVLAVLLVQSFGSFCVNFLSSKFTYEFKAHKNMLLSVFLALASFGLALLLVMYMPQEQRYFGRILGNALVYGLVGAAGCCWILCRGKRFYDGKYWKFCILLSWPLILQNLSYQILGSSDIMMLKQMAGAEASGIYYLALTMSGVMFTIFGALNNSWIPFFFDDMKQGRRENAIRQEEHFLELFTVLSMGFVLLVREVYAVYAKEAFWPGTELIPIFTASYYVNFLCTFPVNYEYYTRKTGVLAAATVTAALINLGLNFIFIQKMGMLGAALATLLSRLLQLTMHELYVRRLCPQEGYPFRLKAGLRFTLLFCVSLILFYGFPNAWLLRWGVGAAIGVWEVWRIWQRRGLL